jgi:hypothetical protein
MEEEGGLEVKTPSSPKPFIVGQLHRARCIDIMKFAVPVLLLHYSTFDCSKYQNSFFEIQFILN